MTTHIALLRAVSVAGTGKIAMADLRAFMEGAGNSKLTNVFIERRLGTRGTARNWNTVKRIADLARGA